MTAVNVTWLPYDLNSTSVNYTYRIEHSLSSSLIAQTNAYSWSEDGTGLVGSSALFYLPTGAQYVFRVTSHNPDTLQNTIPSFPSKSVLFADVPLPCTDLAYYLKKTTPLGVSVQFTPGTARGTPVTFYEAIYTISPADGTQAVSFFLFLALFCLLLTFGF